MKYNNGFRTAIIWIGYILSAVIERRVVILQVTLYCQSLNVLGTPLWYTSLGNGVSCQSSDNISTLPVVTDLFLASAIEEFPCTVTLTRFCGPSGART